MAKKDWKTKAREGGGQYVKFKDGTAITMRIIEGPRDHSFENDDGKKIESLEWDVEIDGETKVLGVSSKRLQQILADEDDDEPLEGTWLWIKASGTGFERNWRVKRVEKPRESREEPFAVKYERDERSESAKAGPVKARPVKEVSSIDELEEEAEKRAKKPRRAKKEVSEED
jgi:hypothetical protein